MALEVWRTREVSVTYASSSELTLPRLQKPLHHNGTVTAGDPDYVLPAVVVANEAAASKTRSSRFLACFFTPPLRRHLVAFSGELVGTICFLFLALAGAQVVNSATEGLTPLGVLLIALSFSTSFAVNSWAFFRITAGMFNPAVTLGLVVSNNMKPARGLLVFLAQLLGGISAAALVSCMFPGELLAQTRLSEGTSVVRGLFIEALVTAWFVFCVFKVGRETYKTARCRNESRVNKLCHSVLASVILGSILFVAEIVCISYTGGSPNPARAFGTAVVTSFPGYHWIYWVGSFLGALVAVPFYRLTRNLENIIRDLGEDEEHEEWLRSRSRNRQSNSTSNYDQAANTQAHTRVHLDAVQEEADLERGASYISYHSSITSPNNSNGAKASKEAGKRETNSKINKTFPGPGSNEAPQPSASEGATPLPYPNAPTNSPNQQHSPRASDYDMLTINRSHQPSPEYQYLSVPNGNNDSPSPSPSPNPSINNSSSHTADDNLDGTTGHEAKRLSIMSKREKIIAGV